MAPSINPRNRHRRRHGKSKSKSSGTLLIAAAVVVVLGLAAGPVLLASAASASSASNTDGGAVVGIDLGTTFSVVGVYRGGSGSGARVDIIPNDQGNRITPSYVSWTESGERLIGDAAKNQAASNPRATVYDAKRLIGREISDPAVKRDAKLLPFDVVDGGDGRTAIRMATTTTVDPDTGVEARVNATFSPEEVSAMILGRMKEIAEAQLGEEVTGAVVTVPAYFNDAQRQATVDAGRIAGLNVMRIINEPTAAAIAYGLGNVPAGQDEANVLVFDLGGGTFDVSLLSIDGETGVFEVLATAGDTHLGGEDFDQRLMAYLVKSFAAKNKDLGDAEIKAMKSDSRALQRLRAEAERVKRVLSSQHSTQAELEALWRGRDLDLTVTRARFEEMNADLFAKTLKPVAKVLEDSGLSKSEVDEIVLVGGSTRIPKVQQLIEEFFDGKELSRGINPDEAVAFGASIQAAMLAGRLKQEIVILDTTALSMGIETAGGIMSTIVPSGTTFPAKKNQIFSTVSDNQPAVSIQVYQGERAMAKDNHMLGRFELTGIPPAPRGVPQIEVEFEVDVDGITHVTARDTASGNSKSIVINSDTRSLSQEEIDRMIGEAERYAEEDKAVRETVAARTQLEAYLYGLKNTLDENEDALKEHESRELGGVVDDAIEWLEDHGEGAGKEELEAKRGEVEAIANPVMRDMYGRANQGGSGGGGGGEFEEEDEDDFEWDDI